jgi:hypothetical protein
MKIHADARTCPNSRKLLVKRVEEEGWSLMAATEAELFEAAFEVGESPYIEQSKLAASGCSERPQPGMSIAIAGPPRWRNGSQCSPCVGLPWQ